MRVHCSTRTEGDRAPRDFGGLRRFRAANDDAVRGSDPTNQDKEDVSVMFVNVTKSLLAASAAAFVAVALTAPAHAQAGLDAAKALLAEHRKAPTFVAPGPAFNAKQCMAGKKMTVIHLSSANPFNVAISKGMTAAARDVGFPLTVVENQGQPPQWIQGISQAVTQQSNLIDLQGGINPEWLGQQVSEARGKGVKVTATHLYDVTQPVPANLLDGAARVNYTRAGEIMAAWAIERTGGKVNAVIMGSDEVVPTTPFVKAIQAYLDKNCPGCKHQYINIPFPEWATKIQSSAQAALAADPNINTFLPIYDNMMTFIVPAVRIAGKEATVRMASYNGSPNILDLQRGLAMETMNVGESMGWVGYAGMDVNMRVLCNQPKVENLNSPLVVFDKSNFQTAGVPADPDKGYGDAHIAGFKRLWGL